MVVVGPPDLVATFSIAPFVVSTLPVGFSRQGMEEALAEGGVDLIVVEGESGQVLLGESGPGRRRAANRYGADAMVLFCLVLVLFWFFGQLGRPGIWSWGSSSSGSA